MSGIACAQRLGNQRCFLIVLILFGAAELRIFVAQMSGQKTAGLRHMHPSQQMRIAGDIGFTCAVDAADFQMNAFYAVDQRLCILLNDRRWSRQ